MKTGKSEYEEGTWFLVPINRSGFIAGVVARMSESSEEVLLGYFFQKFYTQYPDLDELCMLRPSDACETIRFGGMGLRNGEWPIIGKCLGWSSKDWTMPKFIRIDPLSGRRYEVSYNPDDPAKESGVRELYGSECTDLKRDRFSGHLAVERYMAHILGYAVSALDIEKLRGGK